ncbi:MAG: sulfurtransferase TusA family protein [Chloroflexota bacterium]|nr:sulfurtransferase TusA family protein [Chloroflexota bacterium]
MPILFAKTLDLTGLVQPPLLRRTVEELAELRAGDLLEIVTTDHDSIHDFTAWAAATGQDLIESSQLGHVFRFVIRRR